MPDSQTGGTPDFPDIVGFELPATKLSDAQVLDQVAVVMLNVTPSRDWAATFLQQAERFKAQQGLVDVRVIGSTITLIGQLADARSLTSKVKMLVEDTSQARARERLSHRNAPPAPAHVVHSTQILQEDERLRDVAAVAAIANVQYLLAEVVRLTGMRCAAVARVNQHRWTACAVYDLLEFGLKPGQDLVLESTICNEIRQKPRTIAFGQASLDPVFSRHPFPSLYGFESYISVPIWTAHRDFFGTLCALDPRPALLDPDTIRVIEGFAQEIGEQLSGVARSAAAT